MTAVLHPSLTERAANLKALASWVREGKIDRDVAEAIAVTWVAATVPHPENAWADYLTAFTLAADLAAGLVGWPDVDPDLTGPDRHEVALELANMQASAALFRLLYGPEAKPCKRCRQVGRDLISPAAGGGLCGGCADAEWIGGRA